VQCDVIVSEKIEQIQRFCFHELWHPTCFKLISGDVDKFSAVKREPVHLRCDWLSSLRALAGLVHGFTQRRLQLANKRSSSQWQLNHCEEGSLQVIDKQRASTRNAKQLDVPCVAMEFPVNTKSGHRGNYAP
jgi:hypothetical protein